MNVAAFDAHKLGALPLVGDARAGIEALAAALSGHRVDPITPSAPPGCPASGTPRWERLYIGEPGPVSQAQVIGAVNASTQARDVVVCAAGSLPGDLHKLWRTRDPKGYHVEYGYSCMGYEVARGLGVKMADPGREVIVMVGDGSWLMMSSEITTSIQENVRLTVVLIDNRGFGSIGGLSRSLGSEGFGTAYRRRGADGGLWALRFELDLAANAASLGARGVRVSSVPELADALREARTADRTTVIVVECDPGRGVGAYRSS